MDHTSICPKQFTHALSELKEEEAIAEVKKLLSQETPPLYILECAKEGMNKVGEYFESGRYFISGLIMAGEILRQILELVLPLLQNQEKATYCGRVLIGTIKGDIHDIGKDIVAMLLRGHGFEIIDLGVDVPPTVFVEKAIEVRPDVIAISALLTTAFESIAEAVKLLKADPAIDSSSVKILIGGCFIDEQVCQHVGADHWAKDAMDGVRICQRIMSA